MTNTDVLLFAPLFTVVIFLAITLYALIAVLEKNKANRQ